MQTFTSVSTYEKPYQEFTHEHKTIERARDYISFLTADAEEDFDEGSPLGRFWALFSPSRRLVSIVILDGKDDIVETWEAK